MSKGTQTLGMGLHNSTKSLIFHASNRIPAGVAHFPFFRGTKPLGMRVVNSAQFFLKAFVHQMFNNKKEPIKVKEICLTTNPG